MELAIKRDELVYVGRPFGYFAKVNKVTFEGKMVQVTRHVGVNYETKVIEEVPADKIRKLDNVGFKEPSKETSIKKKRMTFNGKGKKAVKEYDQDEMNSVLKELL